MNTLLKIALVSESRFGNSVVASTEVICNTHEERLFLERFFNCFNMIESAYGVMFHVEINKAPVWEFSKDAQIASEVDEENPFRLSNTAVNDIWHIVNEYRYQPA